MLWYLQGVSPWPHSGEPKETTPWSVGTPSTSFAIGPPEWGEMIKFFELGQFKV